MVRVELLIVQERFQLSHIGLTLAPDFPVPKGPRIVVSFPDLRKDQVPPGSRLLVSTEVRDAVLSGNED
jgi:hypothetical protein